MTPQEKARALRPLIEKAAVSLPDEDAVDAVELFPAWAAGTVYSADERIRCGGKLYRCLQPHTGLHDWTPDLTPALWTEIARPGEIPVWKRPTGAQDAYRKGDRVRYPDADGPVYESREDGNVWSPAEYPQAWALREA